MKGFRTDKVHPHGYLPDYLQLATELGPAATVCEIGVYHGHSLAMWQCLFPDGMVIGVDREPSCVWPEGTHQILATQDDPALAEKVLALAPGGCSLIVDDASHIAHLSAETYRLLWPVVAPGGCYVLEDWADAWIHPSWSRPAKHDPSLRSYELTDYAPELINALRDGAASVTYTYEGLVIIRKAAQ